MKAVVVKKPFEIEIQEVENPVITAGNEIIIKVVSGGICGSDMGIYNGTNSLATYPRIIGHEFAGIVHEIGSDVTSVKVGDFVAVDPVNSCGVCFACKSGHHNVCGTLEVTGVHRDGGFAEFVKTTESNAYILDPKKVDLLSGCLVEPYSIGMEVNKRGRISKGDKVLVMGAGPIGITIMQVAKANGAEVMMTDILDDRLELAKDMGANRVVNVMTEKLEDAVNAFTDGQGMPVVADAVCSVKSIEEAFHFAAPSGRVVTLGLLNKPSNIAQVDFTKKGLDVLGSRLNNYRFPEVINLFESKAVSPSKLITQTFHYTKIAEALDFIKNNQSEVCKVVVTFE